MRAGQLEAGDLALFVTNDPELAERDGHRCVLLKETGADFLVAFDDGFRLSSTRGHLVNLTALPIGVKFLEVPCFIKGRGGYGMKVYDLTKLRPFPPLGVAA